MHTQHGSCSYCFVLQFSCLKHFSLLKWYWRFIFFPQLFITCTSALSFVSSQFCAKQKRTDIKRFSILVLVNNSYMRVTVCLIVSMNRQTSNIQISSTKSSHNWNYCNSLIQIQTYTQPSRKLIVLSKLKNSTYCKLTDEVFAFHLSWMYQ